MNSFGVVGFVHVDLRYIAKAQGKGEYVFVTYVTFVTFVTFVAIECRTHLAQVEMLPGRRADTVAWTRLLRAFGLPVHSVLTLSRRLHANASGAPGQCPARVAPVTGHEVDRSRGGS